MPGPRLRISYLALHLTVTSPHCWPQASLLLLFNTRGSRGLREVICPTAHSLGPHYALHLPVAYSTQGTGGWFTPQFLSTHHERREVKIHFIHQSGERWRPPRPLCPLVPVTVGCPPTPDTNFRQISLEDSMSIWKRRLWAGIQHAPGADLLAVLWP